MAVWVFSCVPLEQATTEKARLGELAWCWTKPVCLWLCPDKILHLNSTSYSKWSLEKCMLQPFSFCWNCVLQGTADKAADVVLKGSSGQAVKNAYFLLKLPKWLSSGRINSSYLPVIKSPGIGLFSRAAIKSVVMTLVWAVHVKLYRRRSP